MRVDWLNVMAKCFAVVTLGLGVGFFVGGIAFVGIGREGHLYDSPFGHICEVIGLGAGFLTSSLATFAMTASGGRRDPSKPGLPPSSGLE